MVDFDKQAYPTQQQPTQSSGYPQAAGYPQAGGYDSNQVPAAQYGSAPATAGQSRPRFSDINANWAWVVAAAVFFWPLSFAAASAAGRVVPAMLDGDFARAYAESRRARKLGIIALCVSLGLTLLFIVFYVIVIFAVVSSSCSNGFDC